jgi:hypothetical protein
MTDGGRDDRAARTAEHLSMLADLRRTIELTRRRLHDRLDQSSGGPFAGPGESIAGLLRTLVQATDKVIAKEQDLLRLSAHKAEGEDDPDDSWGRINRGLAGLSARAVAAGFPPMPEIE